MKRLAIVILILAGCAGTTAAAADGEKSDKKPVPRPTKIVPREEWGSTPQPFPDSKKHTPKFVTIHHAGVIYKPGTDPAKFVKNMQAWGQKDKNWPDLPYHFLIAPDGRIFEARDMTYEPDTNTKYLLAGHIGVEMMGDFNQQRPSPQQLDSCARIVAWICDQKKIDVSQIATHKDVAPNQTSCPGSDFYRYMEDGQFKEWVTSILQGKEPQIDPGPPLDGGPTVIVGEGLPTTKPAAAAATKS